MADVPKEFDWVSARHGWTAPKLLADLMALATASTAARNQQLGRELFRLDEHAGGNSFSVFRTEGGQRRAVDFTITGNAVHLNHYDGQTEFDAEPIVDDIGQLKCKVDNSFLEPWQVLRKAMEPFLFG